MNLSKHLMKNCHFNGFLTISPPKSAINGGKLDIIEKYSEKTFQKHLKNISTAKIKEDMTLSKHLMNNCHFNGFLTISPPKTAMNVGKPEIIDKYSEKAFQNCL